MRKIEGVPTTQKVRQFKNGGNATGVQCEGLALDTALTVLQRGLEAELRARAMVSLCALEIALAAGSRKGGCEIKPLLIISFGKHASKSIGNFERKLSFIHPTKAAYGHWKKAHGIEPPLLKTSINKCVRDLMRR